MRKILAYSLILLLAQTAIGQDSLKSKLPPSLYKPIKGDIGFTFNTKASITDLQLGNFNDAFGNNSLFLRYYAKDDLAVRMGVGVTSINDKYQSVDSVSTTLVEWDSTYSRTDFYVSPGLEKHFHASQRLDPYVGGAFNFGSVGTTKMKSNTSITDTTGTSSGTDLTEVNSTMDGGFLFGVNLITGFNYFVTERLSIGAEYSWGYNVLRSGGDWTRISTNTPVNGNATTSKSQGAFLSTVSTLGVNSTAGLTLSYFFGNPRE